MPSVYDLTLDIDFSIRQKLHETIKKCPDPFMMDRGILLYLESYLSILAGLLTMRKVKIMIMSKNRAPKADDISTCNDTENICNSMRKAIETTIIAATMLMSRVAKFICCMGNPLFIDDFCCIDPLHVLPSAGSIHRYH